MLLVTTALNGLKKKFSQSKEGKSTWAPLTEVITRTVLSGSSHHFA